MKSYIISISIFLFSVAPPLAYADSLPPDTFEGAVDLGVIDYIGPVQELQGRKMFRCFFTQAGLHFPTHPFETYYYKFKVNSTKAKVWVRLDEHPSTSMWLRTYNGNRQLLKEYKGHDQELIDEVYPTGEYYVQVLTDGSVSHLPDGTNIGDLTFQGMSGDNYSDVPGQAEPIDLGSLTAGQSIRRLDALSTVQGRTRAWRKPPANCDQSGGSDQTPPLYDDRDDFTLNAPAGHVRAQIVRTFDKQDWNDSLPLYYWLEGNLGGAWQAVPNTGINHPGGQLKLHVGSLAPVLIAPEDSYIGYELDVGMQ
ncbi:hypothetical protein [Bradyrhizobium sp. SZCCHNR2035]|uniref:hypothetical protein n=1 Tax=Bradyrhizobium sp. SZCCHNR2035 TaxID=3057386 RepID=UPI002915EA66|nr:hypothetical protein [Bradyrhizobium sp. SZCCHNR2035]